MFNCLDRWKRKKGPKFVFCRFVLMTKILSLCGIWGITKTRFIIVKKQKIRLRTHRGSQTLWLRCEPRGATTPLVRSATRQSDYPCGFADGCFVFFNDMSHELRTSRCITHDSYLLMTVRPENHKCRFSLVMAPILNGWKMDKLSAFLTV